MARYYCTKDYDALGASFLKWLEEGSMTLQEAINELNDFVKGYLQEKKRWVYWTSAKKIENPKNNKEAWFNVFWENENSEKSLYKDSMDKQIVQFETMEKAIRLWLLKSGLTDKEQARAIKKIEVRKAKLV